MNIYCIICGSEMEVIEDYKTVVKVHPCGCANDNAALTARLDELRMKVLAMPSGKCDADWVAGELAAALKEAGQA